MAPGWQLCSGLCHHFCNTCCIFVGYPDTLTDMDYARPVEALIPGAQGRILGALVRAGAPLNLRTLAQLSGISPGQASRVLPRLVELGVVRRTEVPPSALFELPDRNFGARLVRDLSDAHGALLLELRTTAEELRPAPASVVLFGSAATGAARAGSDIDVLIVRPADGVDEDAWTTSLINWVSRIREFSGNPVNLLEETETDIPRLLRSRRSLWETIRAQGVLVAGKPLHEVARQSA